MEEHGFAWDKAGFRDALCLCYYWLPTGLATNCICGQGFSVNHAMNCPTGGFPTLRHNELRDFIAAVLTEVCSDVRVEPFLQPLSGETLRFATANREDEARVDVYAPGFWGGINTRRLFLMLKCLMLMRLHTVARSYHHFVDGLRGRSRESMNSVLERWRWAHLPLLCSLHLVLWVMRAWYFTKDLPFLFH